MARDEGRARTPWLDPAGRHGVRLPLLDPAGHPAAEPQGGHAPVVRDVLLRHLLGLHLAHLLWQQRHGEGGDRGRPRADGAAALPHPCLWRPLPCRAHARIWRHRNPRAPRLLHAAARHAEPSKVLGRILWSSSVGLPCGPLRNHRLAHPNAEGATCTPLLGAGDPWHNAGAGLYAQGAQPPLARRASCRRRRAAGRPHGDCGAGERRGLLREAGGRGGLPGPLLLQPLPRYRGHPRLRRPMRPGRWPTVPLLCTLPDHPAGIGGCGGQLHIRRALRPHA
mmetsp:Transcript_60562/g.189696  ORF Transcript_60562/g.189696 Transcript_60562/m.189696 type:complete len:280 (+) Transcript_60562:918-1757(+)